MMKTIEFVDSIFQVLITNINNFETYLFDA